MEVPVPQIRQLEILIVESNPADARLIAEAFRDAGLEGKMPQLHSGDQVMPFLQREAPFTDAKQPEMILLDLNLPGKSGIEVLEAIRSTHHLACIPIIILSGSSDPADIERAYRSGANCYIRKPTGLDEFWALIRTCYAFWGHSVSLPPLSREA